MSMKIPLMWLQNAENYYEYLPYRKTEILLGGHQVLKEAQLFHIRSEIPCGCDATKKTDQICSV